MNYASHGFGLNFKIELKQFKGLSNRSLFPQGFLYLTFGKNEGSGKFFLYTPIIGVFSFMELCYLIILHKEIIGQLPIKMF